MRCKPQTRTVAAPDTLLSVIGTLAVAAPAQPPLAPSKGKTALVETRFGDRSLESTIRTDERYGHDGLFQGPRGWCYWNYLEQPKPIQNPNLWPDMRSTYFIGRLAMPAGSNLTLRGRFPYARYFQLALYKAERNTFVAFGESLAGFQIEPDPGSSNPFVVGADRLGTKRDFTIRILAEEAPKDVSRRAKNTLYVGRSGVDIQAAIRIYLPDQDRDGTGWGPANASSAERGFPTYEATLADGTTLTSEQVAQQFAKPFTGETEKPMTTETQYWSVVSCESVPSGQVVNGLSDFQIPLDADRNYTIVVSRPEDRPKNATLENGVAWMKWSPRGEGLDDPRNRADFGMLIMRIMANDAKWSQRPDNIMKPGTEEAVMGPYLPKGHYTTKEEFESMASQVTMTTGQGKTMTLTMQTLPKSRGYQYCELLFDYGDKGSDIYSTSPLAPARIDWWDKLDLDTLAKEFGAKSVHKNGPQWWSMDEVGVMASTPVKVAGIDMVFGAHLPAGTLGIPKYKVFSPAKTQNLCWKAGKPVYQLADPDGHVYVLQGHKVPENSLATLAERFKQLPAGWEYRVEALTEDLVMKLSPKTPIPSVQDEFDQIYIRIPESR